jgi:hypothetical protein
VTFNVENQNAGVINNVAGDQRITGGQAGTLVTLDAARAAVRSLRDVIASTPGAAAADADLDDIDAEMRKDAPDRPTVADHLRRLTHLLVSAGSLVSAGAAIVGPLQTLVAWLGQVGEPIARMLPALL